MFSIFKNNIDASKKSFFFTRKFIVVYNFICQLFDISSYLILQREFQTMKNTVMKEKERNIIEKPQKINVNENSFNINMRQCLDGKNLSIFGRSQKSIMAYKNKKPWYFIIKLFITNYCNIVWEKWIVSICNNS